MRRPIIASALAVSLALPAGALAHGARNEGKPADRRADDHAFAVGRPGDRDKVTREIAVEMNDAMRFRPSRITVKRGETVRFIVRNTGVMTHEMVLGTVKELMDHAELMRKFPEMEHADPNQARVDPGKTGELIWQFTRTGTFDFACLEPGHFEAGMVGRIRVRR